MLRTHGLTVSMRNELTLNTVQMILCKQGVHLTYSGLNITLYVSNGNITYMTDNNSTVAFNLNVTEKIKQHD